ncbi:hypothetical protein [Candidatus Dormiibacter inghamiae]
MTDPVTDNPDTFPEEPTETPEHEGQEGTEESFPSSDRPSTTPLV